MNSHAKPQLLQIKKYPNRRYYDATRSRHVTLQEVHDLITTGHDVCVTDSRTDEDITNLILLQILLEKDQPKLDIFPSAVFHSLIRSSRQVVRTWVERFLGPYMSLLASSQRQFDAYLRQAMSGPFAPQMEWANQFLRAFSQGSDAPQAQSTDGEEGREGTPEDFHDRNDGASLDELRRQVAALTERIETLSRDAPESA